MHFSTNCDIKQPEREWNMLECIEIIHRFKLKIDLEMGGGGERERLYRICFCSLQKQQVLLIFKLHKELENNSRELLVTRVVIGPLIES